MPPVDLTREGAHSRVNDNLLLSAKARADSIPGLEILADDVRRTHGSTNGRVDEESIFYIRAIVIDSFSRSLTESRSKVSKKRSAMRSPGEYASTSKLVAFGQSQ